MNLPEWAKIAAAVVLGVAVNVAVVLWIFKSTLDQFRKQLRDRP